MKRWLILLVICITGFAGFWFFIKSKKQHQGTPPQPIALSVHSDTFNTSVNKMMQAYFDLKDGLVEYDTALVKASAQRMLNLLDSIPMDELKKDSLAVAQTALATKEDIKLNIESLLQQKDIQSMKQDFSSVSDVMFPAFFIAMNYDGPRIYQQYCPMAFGEEQGAYWISNSDSIINPYLGKHDPEYGKTMLNCGEVKESLPKRK